MGKNKIFILALALSILIHLNLVSIELDVIQKGGEKQISIPVTFIPKVEKKISDPNNSPQKKRAIPSAVKSGKGILASDYKNSLISKYLFFLREEIEKNKYHPLESQYYGLIGNVKMAFDITGDGSFDNVRVVRSSGDDLLDKTALKAVYFTNGKYIRPVWSGHQRLSAAFVLKYQYGL